MADVNGRSNTIRSSYRSGYKLYSQFVPMPTPPSSDAAAGKKEEEGGEKAGPVPFRFFTPRECARLQGFPDSYSLDGGDAIPEGALYSAV